jgi:putative tricarboxylic transport membrane protein
MFDTFISALWQLLGHPLYIGALVSGCLLGLFFGVLPGLGGTICLALLLPFTWGMDPFVVMYLFSGVIGAVMVGGSVTSILVNIPGTGGNLATIFDGYPMSQKGEAGKAIGIAAISSVLGGLFGIGWLILLLPVVVFIIMSFAAPEICTLILVGITTIVAASRVNLIKGLSMGGIGMLISFIGYSDTTGVTRYTGGLLFLWDGIGLIPFILGVFAISEVILLVRHGETIAKIKPGMLHRRWANAKDGFKTILQHKLCFLRSSAIGTLVGLVPGIGGAVATLLAYTAEMQSSKHPESFGHGAPEGVLAPEAANNAKDGGALLTTVAFGLPGSAEMVMLLAAFIMHGFAPGPTLLNEHLELVVALIIGLTLSNLLSTLIVIMASK